MVGDSGFRTPSPKPRHFRAQIRANQRDNSPAPNLADLEFPPPPPPLEDDTDDASQCSRSSGSRKDAAQLASGRPVPSPRASLTSAAAIGQPLKSSNDISYSLRAIFFSVFFSVFLSIFWFSKVKMLVSRSLCVEISVNWGEIIKILVF